MSFNFFVCLFVVLGWKHLESEFKSVNGDFTQMNASKKVECRKLLAMLLFLSYRAIMEIENFRYGEYQQRHLRAMSTGDVSIMFIRFLICC